MRALCSPNPVRWPASEVHDGKNPHGVNAHAVQQRVGKTSQQATANRAEDHRRRFGMLGDSLTGVFDFSEEGGAEAWAFEFVVLGGVVEFSFCQRVERDLHFTSAVNEPHEERRQQAALSPNPKPNLGAQPLQPRACRSLHQSGSQDSQEDVRQVAPDRGETA